MDFTSQTSQENEEGGPLEDYLLPHQFMTHEQVVAKYPKTGESRFAIEPLLGKARAIFRNLGYKNIKRIRIYESDEDVIILFTDPKIGKEAIIGCMNPALNLIVMSKPERVQLWLYFDHENSPWAK